MEPNDAQVVVGRAVLTNPRRVDSREPIALWDSVTSLQWHVRLACSYVSLVATAHPTWLRNSMKKTLVNLVNAGKKIGRGIRDSVHNNAKLGLTALALASPFAFTDKASAKKIEGGVKVDYHVSGIGGSSTAFAFIEGAKRGLDSFDGLYDEIPSPENAYVKGVGSIEGIPAYGIANPPLEDIHGSSDSESFSGSIVVQAGNVNLNNAKHYLTASTGLPSGFRVLVNGQDISKNSTVDLGTLTGAYGEGEHSTASWNVSVEYVGTNGGEDPNGNGGGWTVEPPVVDQGPDILRILNCFVSYDTVTPPAEMPGRPWELWYCAGASEELDPCDAAFEYTTGQRLRTVSVVAGVNLQRDARPKGHQGPIFLDLSWVSRAGRPVGYEVFQPNADNYLKVSMPSAAKFGGGKSLVTLQQVSGDPCMTYPIFDLRKVIDKGSTDGTGSSINYLQKVGIVPLAEMVWKTVRLEEPYAVLELRTDKTSIADYDGNKIVDANDYEIWELDYGKTGNSASDIASMKDGKVVLGIPDGRVDQNDLAAFELERERCSVVPIPTEPADGTASGVEGFEGGLSAEWSDGGHTPWLISVNKAHGGKQSIRAGFIGDGQTSALTLRRVCQKGKIRFWRKVSSEQGGDFYRFFIAGMLEEEISGEAEWQQVSFPIRWPGSNLFEWRYEKDGASNAGSDTVWIDDVEIVAE